MSLSNDADLLIAVLRYVVNCLDNDDLDELARMGLGDAEMASIPNLTLDDLNVLTRSPGIAKTILDVKVKPTGLARMVQHATNERESAQIKHALLVNDAPQPMMYTLYRMGFNEYADLRKRQHMTSGRGRPSYRQQDEATVWRAFSKLGKSHSELEAADYMALYRESNVSLRIIWRLLGDWEADGLLSTSPSPD